MSETPNFMAKKKEVPNYHSKGLPKLSPNNLKPKKIYYDTIVRHACRTKY